MNHVSYSYHEKSSTNFAMDGSNLIKILFLASEPSDAAKLRLGQELREIREKLQLSKQRNNFVLESREAVRPGDVTQAIFDVEPHIIHFSGHGTSRGELCLEDLMGKTKVVGPEALAALFEMESERVNCVILNACYSELQARAIAQYIPYVIGMNKEIGDRAAVTFSVGFYKALGANRTVQEAYKAGCVEIRLEGIPEHLTPVLEAKKITDNVHERSKFTVVLTATIDEIDRPLVEAIVAHLRKVSGDTSLTLQRIEPGSVKLFFEISPEGLDTLFELYRNGALSEIIGIPVETFLINNLGERQDRSTPIMNLPSETSNFIGRSDTLQELMAELNKPNANVVSIQGMGGIGKTALAIQCAKKASEENRYPGGILWVNAKTDIPDQILSAASGRLSSALLRFPNTSERLKAFWYSWSNEFEGKKLLILDDVTEGNLEEATLCLPPKELRDINVLVTTRKKIEGGTLNSLSLNILEESESLNLLREIVGQSRIDENLEDAKEICERMGYLPLGIELVGRYLAGSPTISLEELLQKLDLEEAKWKSASNQIIESYNDVDPVPQEVSFQAIVQTRLLVLT